MKQYLFLAAISLLVIPVVLIGCSTRTSREQAEFDFIMVRKSST